MPMNQSERLLAVLLPFVLFAGCQRASESPERAVRSGPELEAVGLELAQTQEPASAASPADAFPPTVTRNHDRTIVVSGVDRWGQPFATTYESLDYLERALPALDRMVSPANVLELERRVKELR